MIQFGTGGWRAVIGDEFTKKNIQLLARAMCDKMRREGVADRPVVLGYDRRFLAKEAMRWAAQVFAAQGIQALLVNKSAPTPLIMYYVMRHELPYGMMVTASHNPAVYNGIKVFTAGGRDADEEQTADIESCIAAVPEGAVEEMEYARAVEEGLIREIYPINEYLDSIIGAVDMESIRQAQLRIALDPMYGVGETSLKTILLTARCDVSTIHGRHDTLFGGKLPSPSALTLRSLQNRVLDGGCDIGLATDGDADRIGVVDDKGRFLHPNDILVLLYYYLVKYKGWKGPVVRNVATTHMLDRVAERFGERCYEVPVGFKHISAKMQEKDAVIGGESSGGLTVRGHIKGKDGVYAAVLLVEMIAKTGKKLSKIYEEIVAECGAIHMEEKDYQFTREKKERLLRLLTEERRLPDLPFGIRRVSYLDGCKAYFENGGWVVARFSGTEPLLRIFCEMPQEQQAKEVIRIYEEFLEL
ncbi:MAG: phosphoglucomutase/phosphomannomutase family protein [Clostridium sp.]|jgi:alpha-D-glucose phosphate-specific phosphoglucomutase|nr:phosphoglucomutase/phosphomannomutase family protein [Clostridium sp.]